MEKKVIAKFAYSGSNKREFFEKEFTGEGESDCRRKINEYVKDQNRGEAKSDRIRFWSLKPVTHKPSNPLTP